MLSRAAAASVACRKALTERSPLAATSYLRSRQWLACSSFVELGISQLIHFNVHFLDSTVLAYIMTLLNDRYDYGLDLCLLSIDEGISGYRDASLDVRTAFSFLQTVHRPIADPGSLSVDCQAQRRAVRSATQDSVIS